MTTVLLALGIGLEYSLEGFGQPKTLALGSPASVKFSFAQAPAHNFTVVLSSLRPGCNVTLELRGGNNETLCRSSFGRMASCLLAAGQAAGLTGTASARGSPCEANLTASEGGLATLEPDSPRNLTATATHARYLAIPEGKFGSLSVLNYGWSPVSLFLQRGSIPTNSNQVEEFSQSSWNILSPVGPAFLVAFH